VTPLPDVRIVAGDGHEPKELDPDQLVSMNLWGFTAEMLGLLEAAADFAQGGEVLLPEVVDRLLAQRRESSAGAAEVKVLRASGRCIGVTHAADVPLVQAELAREVGRGERPAQLWSSEPVVGQ
jgi:hypothetical protein